MATRAEQFRHDAERSGKKKAATPAVPAKAASTRHTSKAIDRKRSATYAFEDSATKPSRLSTRKSSNRQKNDVQFRLKDRVAESLPARRTMEHK